MFFFMILILDKNMRIDSQECKQSKWSTKCVVEKSRGSRQGEEEEGDWSRVAICAYAAAQSLLGRSKVLEHLGRRDAPEGGRELVHTDC
jgi:hypothetical protein